MNSESSGAAGVDGSGGGAGAGPGPAEAEALEYGSHAMPQMWPMAANPMMTFMQQQMHPHAQQMQQQQHQMHAQQMHHHHQQQQQQMQHHRQQQQFNEFLYSIQTQFPAPVPPPPSQPETYSVLPMGHGNFLKVYHCNDNGSEGMYAPPPPPPQAAAPQPGLSAGYMPFHHAAQVAHPQHHIAAALNSMHSAAAVATVNNNVQAVPAAQAPPQQQCSQPATSAATVPIFNSYELFASNSTLMPTTEVLPLAPQDAGNNNSSSNTATPAVESSNSNSNTTSMIINQLVNNWSPNLTGNCYTQFGSVAPAVVTPIASNLQKQQPAATVAPAPMQTQNMASHTAAISAQQPTAATANTQPTLLAKELVIEPEHVIEQTQQLTTEAPKIASKANVNEAKTMPPSTLPSETAKAAIILPLKSAAAKELQKLKPTATVAAHAMPDVVKKRIIAEVKPMRMTYSDVLSKVNNLQGGSAAMGSATGNAAANSSSKHGSGNGNNGSRKSQAERKSNDAKNGAEASRKLNSSAMASDNGMRKSPLHENKENLNMGSCKNGKRNSNGSNLTNTQKSSAAAAKKDNAAQKQKRNMYASTTATGAAGSGKRIDSDLYADNLKHAKANLTDKDYNSYYNVTAKASSTSSSSSSSQNINISANNSSSQKSFRNSKTTSSMPQQAQTQFQSSSSNRKSHSLNSASTYSYSSKRNSSNRGSANNSSSSTAGSSRQAELAKRFLRAWYIYTLKFLTWLFYLVYDIVVIGFSMAYERSLQGCICAYSYAKQFRQELRQNSNKPGQWLRMYWRRFDAKFQKDSVWAVWRRFYKKKPPEPTTENFKGGRLPQTGEEAMYSLLNCKGKDAYSILGVPPNSSQEQIRKHYKKIAVLVHPDKNKQAGAEEAFKVLQRAFELIGVPENRMAYDQSLAEALHAEKAWTELHDLLSQLQTKITEAANTIRCSTCGLRHPRKMTERPHYAARECASCKIRHSAREGDIWAETSMLGLRWKYLALMEGKVYDITEWANCQKGALSHLEPNSHIVQYRIVRGAQQQQQQQQTQQQQQQRQQSPQHHVPGAGGPGAGGKYKRDMPTSEATLHEFLDNLYSGQHPNASTFAGSSTRRRNRRN